MSDKDEFDKALEGVKVMLVEHGLPSGGLQVRNTLIRMLQSVGCIIVNEKIVPNKSVSPCDFSSLSEACFSEKSSLPYRDNSFRGGSIGKGGKVKYRRQ